jgi:catechol 2,3-dioxygenase-like lactoylglutathione lyase family enzyme
VAHIEGLSHLTVHVTELNRSETFYEDVMGLEPMGRDLVDDDGPTSLFRTESGQMVVLVEVDAVEPFRGKTTSIHHAWYLTPEQHAEAIERMESMGEEIGDTREAFRAMGQKSFDVYDPDGHRYQVQTVGPEAYEILKPNRGTVACGHIDDYAVGAVELFNDAKLYLVRSEDGFLALSRWCTHMNGLLQWRPNHWYFFCPYHMATFNRCGLSTSHSPYETLPPLRIHPLAIDGAGNISVDTDVVLIRKEAGAADATPAEPGAATTSNRFESL